EQVARDVRGVITLVEPYDVMSLEADERRLGPGDSVARGARATQQVQGHAACRGRAGVAQGRLDRRRVEVTGQGLVEDVVAISPVHIPVPLVAEHVEVT